MAGEDQDTAEVVNLDDGDGEDEETRKLKSKYKHLEKFFVLTSHKDEKLYFKCQLCPSTSKPKSAGESSLSNLQRHITSMHSASATVSTY